MKQLSKLTPVTLLAGVAIAASSLNVSASDNLSMVVKSQMVDGAPSFVTGNLGSMSQGKAKQALQHILATQAAYDANGKEDFRVRREWIDEKGKSHFHFEQRINGLKVYGTSMTLHVNAGSNALSAVNTSGNIYAINGALAVDTSGNSASLIANNDNGAQALAAASLLGEVKGRPELAYLYQSNGKTSLVWRVEVAWDNGPGDFGRDFVYFDAASGELVERHAQVHSALSRRTYTLNGGSQSSAPGQLLCVDNQSCGSNQAAQRAHDGAAGVYNYYSQVHGRDSLNNSGYMLISSVDLNEENAYWTGSQMLYGHAGSFVDNDFTTDFDIIGHEFTHGLTNFTARLTYQDESGALNEAWSDIMGLSAEAFKDGKTTSTWMLGDGLFNTPGKAARYLNNPTQDGQSKDFYPERYTGVQDHGGVHSNSGIANLAYVLLVDGGSHPRNKTTAQVTGIGMNKAEKIFYRALTTYMNESTQFSGARAATAQAAADLYGNTEKLAVETAWCAVGVGTCPAGSPDPTPDPTPSNVLENGVPVTGLSASSGQSLVYTMDIPAGATDVKFSISGGTGDADLYIQFGSEPTDSSYECRPYASGNSESCNGTKSGGTYYVRVKAYSSFSGVTLTGSFTAATSPDPDPTPAPINDTVTNISVAAGQWVHYTKVLPAGYSTLTVTTSGGSGDADLYVRKGAQSTSTAYNCRSWEYGNDEICTFNSPEATTWYIDINGYSSASGITLTLQANP